VFPHHLGVSPVLFSRLCSAATIPQNFKTENCFETVAKIRSAERSETSAERTASRQYRCMLRRDQGIICRIGVFFEILGIQNYSG
jgi:hypothetical protein